MIKVVLIQRWNLRSVPCHQMISFQPLHIHKYTCFTFVIIKYKKRLAALLTLTVNRYFLKSERSNSKQKQSRRMFIGEKYYFLPIFCILLQWNPYLFFSSKLFAFSIKLSINWISDKKGAYRVQAERRDNEGRAAGRRISRKLVWGLESPGDPGLGWGLLGCWVSGSIPSWFKCSYLGVVSSHTYLASITVVPGVNVLWRQKRRSGQTFHFKLNNFRHHDRHIASQIYFKWHIWNCLLCITGNDCSGNVKEIQYQTKERTFWRNKY